VNINNGRICDQSVEASNASRFYGECEQNNNGDE
jgi:hypothetical protein